MNTPADDDATLRLRLALILESADCPSVAEAVRAGQPLTLIHDRLITSGEGDSLAAGIIEAWHEGRQRAAEWGLCKCGRPLHGLKCRCTCEKCGGHDLTWKAWGAYLDKDLICACGHVQDIWDC